MTGAISAAAAAGSQPPSSATPAPTPPPPPGDESFIEFLGGDDVGDAGWWEFLKKTDPHAQTPSPPPDSKQ
jgi:hypothetical protein